MSTPPRIRRGAAVAMGLMISLQAFPVLASGEAVPPSAESLDSAQATKPAAPTSPDAVAETVTIEELAAVNETPQELPSVDAIPNDLPGVAQATFTTEISDREPVDNVTFIDSDLEKIYFFTDLRNLKGQTVTHQWEHRGEVVSNVPFDIRGDRWRVWSSKGLAGDRLGEWKASVLTEDGIVIETRSFTLSESPAAPSLGKQ